MIDDLVKRLRLAAKEDDQAWARERWNEAADRIAALIAAGDKLAGFDGHWHGCRKFDPAEYDPPCSCGYVEAVKAWKELTK